MTKPKKWHVRPAKTQISLGICPVWSVFAVRMKKAWVLTYPLTECTVNTLIWLGGRPGWPESSLGTQSFCWFCHEAAQLSMEKRTLKLTWIRHPLYKLSKNNHAKHKGFWHLKFFFLTPNAPKPFVSQNFQTIIYITCNMFYLFSFCGNYKKYNVLKIFARYQWNWAQSIFSCYFINHANIMLL